MNILGLTDWLGCHDSSAALACDGDLVAAAEEERFSRLKHDGSVPFQAIDFCLRHAGIRMTDVDAIAIACKPYRSGRDSPLVDMDTRFLQKMIAEGGARRRSLIHKRLLDVYHGLGLPLRFNWRLHPRIAAGLEALRRRYSEIPLLRFYDHHHSHAAAAYLTSGYERAAVVTVDGRGGSYSSVTWDAQGHRIMRLRAEPFTNSLGFFYRDCTLYLGFGEFGEGKTMGLAAYGEREALSATAATILDTSGPYWYRYGRPPAENLLGFPPRTTEPATELLYRNFAAACQSALERAAERIARSAVSEAGITALCLGGGVALNCSCNGKLLASGLASRFWGFPAANDAGLSVGAAFLCALEAGELVGTRLEHGYWGPEFSSAEYEAALRRTPGIRFQHVPEVVKEVARRLTTGDVVGWFQGRMELGPRALGNRSILADPRTRAMRDRVNRIKGRDPWRPLSPAVLAERASEFFSLDEPSPFMLLAARVLLEKRDQVAGIVHVDGSVRPQTITREQNPLLHDLLSAFARETGLPLLINTSFNAAGEPIVCTPEDAIKTFLATGLDVLVLGNYVARREAREVDAVEVACSKVEPR